MPTKKKRKKQPKSDAWIKYVGLGAALLAVLLIVLIVILDHKAVEKGQMGLYDEIAGVKQAQSLKSVIRQTKKALLEFDISKKNLIQEGSTPGRKGNRLKELIYRLNSADQWLDAMSGIEAALRKNGVTVHNRTMMKNADQWRFTLYLGSPKKTLLRIALRFYPKGEAGPETPTPAKPGHTQIPKPAVALVFDDFGADIAIAKRFLTEIDIPVTLAVMPYLKHTSDTINLIKTYGQTAFLHLPLEPESPEAMGNARKDFLLCDMSDKVIHTRLSRLLNTIPHVDGVNNHMGSKFTSDKSRMRVLLKLLKQYNLPFLDSRTIASSVGAQTAAQIHLLHSARDVFIDQGYKGGDVAANLEKLAKIARKKGTAVGIGHAQPATLEALKKHLPRFIHDGIHFVSVLDLMHTDDSAGR